MLADHAPAVAEDVEQLPADRQGMCHAAEGAEGDFVNDAVEADDALILRGRRERVLVVPERVRPADLQIDELPRRGPFDDLAAPPHRNAGPAEGGIEDRV